MKTYARMFALAVLITTVFPALVFAAGLTGSVTDSETGKPLAHVTVRIAELNTGAITGGTGTFSFDNLAEGTYTVAVSHTGYAAASRRITIPSDKTVAFRLEVSPYTVDEIVTTARGRETSRNEIPGSVEIITGDDIMESNPTGISNALAAKPGISSGGDMPWGADTVIRGMSKDQVVMLVDGARVVTATTVPAQFGTVAQGDVERVEVLKGPLSVLYGSGSTGGVVNVITKSGHFTSEPNIGFTLNPSYESAAGGVSSYERVHASNDRVYLSVSQANRKYGDYRTADDKRIRNSQFQDRQTQANFGIRISDTHTLEARYQYFSVIDVGIPGGAAFPPKAIATYPTTSRELYDVAWTWRPAGKMLEESRLNVYYQPVIRRVKLLPNAPAALKPHPMDATKSIRLTPQSIYPDGNHYVHGFRWQNVLNLGSHDLVTGVEGWQKKMDGERTKNILKEIVVTDTGEVVGEPSMMVVKDTPVPESIQRPIGVFAEDSFPLGDRFKVTLGGRFDHIHTENEKSYLTDSPKSDVVLWDEYDDDDVSWSVVAGTVFNATDAIDLNLTVARSFRSPTIEERYLYANLAGIVTVGDPEIDPEQGTFVEGGVTARIGSVKLTGQAFVNSITDMVIRRPGGDLKGMAVDYQYTNAGEALLRGFELGADWAVTPRLLLTADLSHTRGTDEKDNTDLPSMPPTTAHLGARWGFGNGFWFQPTATFVDRQDKTAPGEDKTPGYGTLTLTAGKSLLRTGDVTHSVVIGVKNVTDKLYRDHLTTSRGYEMYGMGRSLFVSWNVTGN